MNAGKLCQDYDLDAVWNDETHVYGRRGPMVVGIADTLGGYEECVGFVDEALTQAGYPNDASRVRVWADVAVASARMQRHTYPLPRTP